MLGGCGLAMEAWACVVRVLISHGDGVCVGWVLVSNGDLAVCCMLINNEDMGVCVAHQ